MIYCCNSGREGLPELSKTLLSKMVVKSQKITGSKLYQTCVVVFFLVMEINT